MTSLLERARQKSGVRTYIALILLSLLPLTSCGGGSSTNEESFVSGSGAVTFIKAGARVEAPVIKGALLGGGTLSPHKGITVVNVWASWCSPCRAEAPTLEALKEKYPDVHFVGILTRDSQTNALSFVRKFGITYPTLIDDAILADFSRSLPANAIPTTLVLDTHGGVAARISGQVTVASLSNLIDRVKKEGKSTS